MKNNAMKDSAMKHRLSGVLASAAAAAALFMPLSAYAQSADSEWSVKSSLAANAYDTKDKLAINVSRCIDMFNIDTGEISFIFTHSGNTAFSNSAEYTVKLARGGESCTTNTLDDAADDKCETLKSHQKLTTGSTIEIKRKVNEIAYSVKSSDSCNDAQETVYIHLIVNNPSLIGQESLISDIKYAIDFRTVRPASPANISASAGGSSIKVSWDSVSGASSYKVYYGKEGVSISSGAKPEELKDFNTAATASSSVTLKSGISADTSYILGVTAIDSDGNESLIGEVVTAETIQAKDFWQSYREENQDADGGFCFIATAAYGSTQEPHVKILRQFRDSILLKSDAGRAFVETYYRLSPPLAHYIGQHPAARTMTRIALWPLYGFAFAALYAPAAIYLALALMAAGIGWAVWRRRRRSQRQSHHASSSAALLLAASALAAGVTAAPNIAAAESPCNMMFEFKAGPYTPDNLGKAYDDHFGDNASFIIEGEYDWQFWRGVGSLGLGFHLGYGNVSGSSINKETGESSVDSTKLHWLPLRLSLVYRFDYLWTEFRFPFTIYAKAGFDYSFYWIVDGSDSIAADGGKKGSGGVFGFHAVAGIAFVLDWLAPEMEKAIDFEWGINNSYIFAEYMYANLNDFGKKGSFDLTEKATFMIGLGLEF